MKNYPESTTIPAMIDHGLSERQLNLIRNLIREFAPGVKSVSLFGSRATNSHRSYSDIDMVLYGDVKEDAVDRLWTCFNESSLPYKVDLVAYHLINYPPLKAHIDRFAKTLFSTDQLTDRQSAEKEL